MTATSPTNGTTPGHTVSWLDRSIRTLAAAQRDRFEGYLAEMFTGPGMDLDTPGTADTPRRLLLAARLVDELFLTVAPQVVGRAPHAPRLGLVEGTAFDVRGAPGRSSSTCGSPAATSSPATALKGEPLP